MLIAALTTSTVWAGGLKLSGSFTSGSLHFDGSLTVAGGSFPKGMTLELTGIGIPEVTCTNQGGQQSPGQNPSKVTASGVQYISPDQLGETTKRGKTLVSISADEDVIVITAKDGGCPNDNWTATITSIEWIGAIIDVHDGTLSGPVIATFVFECDPALQVGNTLSCVQTSP
jgi:hypothetical protein